jgi:hypothetical protein
VWELARRSEDPVSVHESLDRYVDLYRKTRYYDGGLCPTDEGFVCQDWELVKYEIDSILQKHECDTSSRRFERDCLALLWPLMEPRLERDAQPLRKGPERTHGCWTHTIREQTQLSLHIANVYRPESPFDRMDEFAGDLLSLIQEARASNPELDALFCATWMNHLPKFQALFPEDWIASFHDPCEYGNSNGTWGQYIDRRGGFHRKNAKRFRATGRHPLLLGGCKCDLDQAIRYLQDQGWKKRLA